MKIVSRVVALAVLALPAVVFAADIAEDTVLAYDRKARIIVFTDKTVWSLENLERQEPGDLEAGDRIEVRYESNEDDGVWAVHSIEILR